MKRNICIIAVLGSILLWETAVAGLFNYSQMSNEELFQLRRAIPGAPAEDQAAYQEEWEKRLTAMTDEEKKKFVDTSDQGSDGSGEIKRLWSPGSGYDQQGIQGQIIFGGTTRQSGGSSK